MTTKQVKQLDRVIIRFAGDSGDGMQLTGDRFTQESAAFGNDLSTLPNFPAEIRAPQGTLPGVSSFQVHFADHDILTPGDAPDVLVAMNPAALRANLGDLPAGATIIVDTHDFSARNLTKAGYTVSPLDDESLAAYAVHPLDLTGMTVEAVKQFGLSRKDAARAKNMFALGLVSWMYGRPTESTISFLEKRFAKVPDIRDANVTAYQSGWNFGETTEAFVVRYEVKPAPMSPGTYRNITGNLALAYGLVAGGVRSGLPLFLGSYPITPASDILHELSKHKSFGVTTFQAEDEIAGIGAALGASFAGSLGVTTTSGPGLALKSETIGLAVMTELPLLVIDVQRGGPSTGLPTKTEQADLLQAMFGRNGESPVPIVAPRSPGDCFDAALEATRIAVTYRTPVMLLSDGMIANGSEPWRIPELDELPEIDPGFATARNQGAGDEAEFWPYLRDEETLARPWAIPGTAGLEHRIGGLEKADGNGNISYDPANHDFMVRTRQAKVDRIAESLPPLEVDDPSGQAKVLVLGWGSTYGPIGAGCRRVRNAGYHVAQVHLRHLNPLPRDLGDILKRYERVLIPEMNLGQLGLLIRGRYLVDAVGYHQVNGMPLKAAALAHAIADLVAEAEGIEAPLGVWGETVVKEHAQMSTDRDPHARDAQRHRAGAERRRCADRQGVHLRPGGALVPGLRRLRRAQGRAGLPARPRPAPREHRVRLRHRLLVAVPLLPRHLRHALDPRPRAGDRHRHRHLAPGPVRLGRHRRRRRAVDRRQPPDPRAAPQPEHDDPAVQQPDLRPDQGPVLPHLRGRQGHQVDADGVGGPPVQPGLAGARRGGHVRGPHHRLRPQAPHRGAVRGRRPPGHLAGRDLPELPDLQRRRLRRDQGPRPLGRLDHPARGRPADPLRPRRQQGTDPRPRPPAASRSRRSPRSARTPSSSTTPAPRTRPRRSRSRGSPTRGTSTARPSASSARSSGRRTTTRPAPRSTPPATRLRASPTTGSPR